MPELKLEPSSTALVVIDLQYGIVGLPVTGYLLAPALPLPLSGWLVDRIGVKRVYLL